MKIEYPQEKYHPLSILLRESMWKESELNSKIITGKWHLKRKVGKQKVRAIMSKQTHMCKNMYLTISTKYYKNVWVVSKMHQLK